MAEDFGGRSFGAIHTLEVKRNGEVLKENAQNIDDKVAALRMDIIGNQSMVVRIHLLMIYISLNLIFYFCRMVHTGKYRVCMQIGPHQVELWEVSKGTSYKRSCRFMEIRILQAV